MKLLPAVNEPPRRQMDGYERLASAIIVQALIELVTGIRADCPRGKRQRDPDTQREALEFFASPDLDFWADRAGIEAAAIRRLALGPTIPIEMDALWQIRRQIRPGRREDR